MELSHSFTVPATVEQAWDTFMDIEGVATCFPGAKVTDASTDEFHGTVKVKLGPIALTYAGSGAFVERDDSTRRAVIEAKGKDKRGGGTAGATVTIILTEEGERQTRADVGTDLTITGRPAQFGRGVIQDVSDKLLRQFVSCIEGRFAEAGAPATTAAAGVGATPSEAPAEAGVGGRPATEAAPPEAAASEAGAEAAETAPAEMRRPTAPPTVAPSAGVTEPAAARTEDVEALDLGRAVIPVLLRTYGPYVAVGLVGLAIGFIIGWAVGG